MFLKFLNLQVLHLFLIQLLKKQFWFLYFLIFLILLISHFPLTCVFCNLGVRSVFFGNNIHKQNVQLHQVAHNSYLVIVCIRLKMAGNFHLLTPPSYLYKKVKIILDSFFFLLASFQTSKLFFYHAQKLNNTFWFCILFGCIMNLRIYCICL